MALKNANLQKVGNSASEAGYPQMQLVKPATALADPGGFDGTPSWHAKRAAYVQSVQVTQKFSQDWE